MSNEYLGLADAPAPQSPRRRTPILLALAIYAVTVAISLGAVYLLSLTVLKSAIVPWIAAQQVEAPEEEAADTSP